MARLPDDQLKKPRLAEAQVNKLLAHRKVERKRIRTLRGRLERNYKEWEKEFMGSASVTARTASTRHKLGKVFGKPFEKGNETRSKGRRKAGLKERLAPKYPGWFPCNSGSLLSWGDILDIRLSSRSARDLERWYGVSDNTIKDMRDKIPRYCEREKRELSHLIRQMTLMLKRGGEAYQWILELRKRNER